VTTKKLTKPRSYSQTEIQDGLIALALANGSSRNAAKELKRQGRPIPAGTLQAWKKKVYAAEYERAAVEVRDRIYERMGDQWRQVVEEGAKATREAMEKGREATKAGDQKAASAWANAARSFSVAGGVAMDKGSLADGRPTSRQEYRNPATIMKELRDAGILIEGTAEELPSEEGGDNESE
jgi:hypothetical protein